ncbi:transposase [Clostridium sp.]|uniref:transposase n=1 Tax=Clostridium sp. TaxID=1506 RepID=UPI00387EA77C
MQAYSQNGRNPAVPPKILFQIVVYAYMNDILSSRKIELACKRDINLINLL